MARITRGAGRQWRHLPAVWLIVAIVATIAPFAARADEADKADEEPVEQPAAVAGKADEDDSAEEEVAENGVTLPTDRLRERQLERARRLVAGNRWSDAATLLDEILAADRDFFFRLELQKNTWRSIKSEAARLVGELPPEGREAYSLQFRARAERLLAQSIVQGDADEVIAVARRWSHTPAGQQATLLAALAALEANQPLAAVAWLDRLTAASTRDFEPTLSLMRAKAWWLAGQRDKALGMLEQARGSGKQSVRIGGRDVSLSFPPGNGNGGAAAFLASIAGDAAVAGDQSSSSWWLHRGDAARNAVSAATRPLLVPRYRVPLTRHPEEARRLERSRKQFADRDTPLLPAGKPLAVSGLIVLHTPMGLLAVDFDSGKRVWLQTGGSAALWADGRNAAAAGEGGDDELQADSASSVQSVFGDATSGTLSSNGRLVFAVETTASDGARPAAANGMRRIINGPSRPIGNRLSAYDVSGKGELRWRLPAAGPQTEAADAETWYMGAPLVLGDQLFVLVEERGEIRLDVLAATDGSLLWSQPLAELDEDQTADMGRAQQRRLSGLSPSFAEGVLVCPTGSGALVALDLATRTLLWASNYAVPAEQGAQVMRFGVRVQVGGLNRPLLLNGQLGGARTADGGWRDAAPILAAGRVILGAVESEKLLCLDLRSGGLVWEVPREQSLSVAGVVDGRVIVVGRHGVDALSLADGKRAWAKPVDIGGASPSGCGVVTPTRLFLPTDAPEVVEIVLADGSIAGRSPARSGVVPGNLVAHRGELISQGFDSLDVFHQAAPLEERIETALRQEPADPWALLWRGQLDLDRGDIAAGLRRIREARAASPDRINADVVGDALLFAMRRDFAAAAPIWREALADGAELPRSAAMLRLAVDRFMQAGDLPSAWAACRECLGAADVDRDGEEVIEDASDAALAVSEPRWFQGRLLAIHERAAPELRAEIDAFVADRAQQLLEPGKADADSLGRFVAAFGCHPAALDVKRALAVALDREATAGESGRAAAARRDLVRLDLARASGEPPVADAGADPSVDLAAAWPVGRVVAQRGARPRPDDATQASRVIPIPVDVQRGAAVPDVRLGFELHSQLLIASDGLGRRIGEPFAFDSAARFGGMGNSFQAMGAEAALVGRILFIRSGPLHAAFCVTVPGGDGKAAEPLRRLWMASDGTDPTTALPGMGFAVGRGAARRLKRSGNVPLGMPVSEPEEMQLPARGVQATATGVAILAGRSLELRDPVSGDVIWQRHRLPVDGELFGDEDFLCVCPRNGKGAVVVSMIDGRVERTCDLPRHEQRLLTAGRGIVVVEPIASPRAASGGVHPQVKLELLDPATLVRRPLGTFAGESRAALAGAGLLAVVEPKGRLTLLDVGRSADGGPRFSVPLNDMPAGLQSLQVMPWQDRLLVIVGRQETGEEQQRFGRIGLMSALPMMVPGEEPAQPVTGAVWAVSRESGEMLWPVPATIVRHALTRHQPAALPVMLFARTIVPPREGERQRLSLLCLDKRTGHAVHIDDKIVMQNQMPMGCEMIGDPITHEITVAVGDAVRNRGSGFDPAALRLVFTGEPTPPRPPYQASAKPPVTSDLTTELEYWLRKGLTIPLPF
jgi:hypothetical protein